MIGYALFIKTERATTWCTGDSPAEVQKIGQVGRASGAGKQQCRVCATGSVKYIIIVGVR